MTDDFDFLSDYWGDDEDGPESGDWLSEPSPAEKAFVDEILAIYGIDNASDLVIEYDVNFDVSQLRGDRFATLAEAIIWLHDIGVLGFSQVVWYEDEGLWGPKIPNCTPGDPRYPNC